MGKKNADRRSSRKAKPRSRCPTRRDVQRVQPFPTSGLLVENLGLPLPDLKDEIGKPQYRAYSYIVRSVKLDHETETFEQCGSGPNFQGDILTLCTCKHQMRARRVAEDWPGVWIAGFTSRTIYDGRHWLFFLAQIDSAFESHSDLWKNLRAVSRNAKAAHAHFLGDVFKPKSPSPTDDARFSPRRYVSPTLHAHRWRDDNGWHNGWHNDINYHLAHRFRQPPLLLADPHRTFLWEEPMIYFARDHSRNYRKWSSLQDLFAQLR